jgi:RNA polymerase sigma-70 factor (ECF subfamily)
MADPDLEQLLYQRARRGDDTAFAQLVEITAPRLYGVARRIAGNPDAAQTIVQECYVRTWIALRSWRTANRPDEDRPFFAYLVKVAVNLARDQWRREQVLEFTGLDDLEDILPDSEAGPEMQFQQSEMKQSLAQAVAKLPAGYRAVIVLRYDAGYSYDEIAKTLGLPVNTVRTHLRRAKAQLRQVLVAKEVGE